jgi:hypothetical protein
MFLVSMGLAAGVAGCAGHASRSHGVAGGEDRVAQHAGVAELSIEPGAYERAFAIARERLMDYRFAIDRVDARRGVITTHPKRTAGLASPWDQEQSGLGQEWEDLINEQRRVVRIEFDLEDGEASSMSVTVELLRTHRPGWRVESESVRLSTHARTRDELGRIEPASYTERIGLDARFAERLAWSIEASLRE